MQWNLLEIGHGVDLGLGVLHRQHVVISVLGIDPVAGSDHAVRGQRGDHIVDRFLRRHSHAPGHFAIDIELNAGIVEVLRNKYIADAMKPANFGGDLGRGLVSLLLIVPANLDVNGRRQSEVDDRIYQTSGLEVRGEFGQIVGQFRRAPGACTRSCPSLCSFFRLTCTNAVCCPELLV